MSEDFVICTRRVKSGVFENEPGPTRFLAVPTGKLALPEHEIKRTDWVKQVVALAETGKNPVSGLPVGHLLVFIHGYNNGMDVIMNRHRQIRKDLEGLGYDGAVASFDWPSADNSFNYLEDRIDAKKSAMQLVDDGVLLFVDRQKLGCEISVHVLAHSTGAFVVREAFDDADDRAATSRVNWTVSQVMFIGGDISRGSLAAGDSKSSALFRHSVRITNYSNPYDSVLKLSNVKRAGLAPRVGRAGIPDDAPPNCTNVNCGEYWKTLDEKKAKFFGSFSHSWHIGDPVFARDMLWNIRGDLDRNVFPTRKKGLDGKLTLQKPGP